MSDEILRHGSKGESVRKLQRDLNALGYEVAVDGIFGPITEKAVRGLQAAFGYTVDGLVGKGTRFLIEQQTGLKWHVGMPTAFTPGTATKPAVEKPAPEVSTMPPAQQQNPVPSAAPAAAAPAAKGPLGNKAPQR
jgi:peptidoglycan hydrolase-like protein with peptidoglycan-binding domain